MRGVYWTRPSGGPSAATVLRAARLFAGGGTAPLGVVVGRSAVKLWGFGDSSAPWLPELVLPGAVTRRQPVDLRYRWDRLQAADLTTRDGMPCTTVSCTLVDIARTAPFAQIVVLADAALRLGLVTREQLTEATAGQRGSAALSFADGRAESAFESLVRTELAAAGLPPPLLQHEVRDGTGRLVARVDFAWPQSNLVVEADGSATHTGALALRDDLRRQNLLVDLGLTVLRFTWGDLGFVAPKVRAALSRGARRAA